METNSNEMNMESTDLIPSEWHEKFNTFLKEERELLKKSSNNGAEESLEMDYDSYEDDDDDDKDDDYLDDHQMYEDDDDSDNYQKYENTSDEDNYDNDDDMNNDADDINDDADISDDDNIYTKAYDKRTKKIKAQCDARMTRMSSLLAGQPRLERICKDEENKFLSTCFTTYIFGVNNLREKANDLKYLVNLCGTNLTRLNVKNYPSSQIMPIINANCPNVWDLALGFKEITSQDFENCFSNMPNLEKLLIHWQCENSILPMTLAKSLKQIGGILKNLNLSSYSQGNGLFSPDSLGLVLPELTALKSLDIHGFILSQLFLESIGEMNNLACLSLTSSWPKNHRTFDTIINMYPVGNLKNLESAVIDCDYGVTDEFLVNLCNNAKKLTTLNIFGKNITDTGMAAINNLEQLEVFDLGLDIRPSDLLETNEFITDESIQCLFNQKLDVLDISQCINVTDKSVLKLVKNLPNLTFLSIKNTKVTREAVKEIYESRKQSKNPVEVHYTFKNGN